MKSRPWIPSIQKVLQLDKVGLAPRRLPKSYQIPNGRRDQFIALVGTICILTHRIYPSNGVRISDNTHAHASGNLSGRGGWHNRENRQHFITL